MGNATNIKARYWVPSINNIFSVLSPEFDNTCFSCPHFSHMIQDKKQFENFFHGQLEFLVSQDYFLAEIRSARKDRLPSNLSMDDNLDIQLLTINTCKNTENQKYDPFFTPKELGFMPNDDVIQIFID